MTRCQIAFLLAMLGSIEAFSCKVVAADRPNIILFLADDLGYAEIGVNGCKDITTPSIDSIALQGVRFTDGYAGHCVCAPTRAALMSGMYQHRFGFEFNPGPEASSNPEFGLPRNIPSLAEKLQQAGYATGMIGKWHIGFQDGMRPDQRGFDYHYGFLGGAHPYQTSAPAANRILRNGQPTQPKKYLTDQFADEAVEFVERSKDKPFFLYLAFNAVHSPMGANPYDGRFPELTGKRKTFAGMLTALDVAVGRVMEKVRELGEEENTLIFFYSDNGGPTQQITSRNDPLRGFKGQLFEGGIRVPFVMQWKGQIPAGQTYRHPVMGFDCHATALAAAGVLPEDHRLQIAPSVRDTPEGSKAEVVEGTNQPLDGVNLLPFVTGQIAEAPHEQLFWRAGASYAVRSGPWKLLHLPQQGGTMLFDLQKDLSEENNLAASHPEKLKELQGAFVTWVEGVQPPRWGRQGQRDAGSGNRSNPNPPAPNRRPRQRMPRVEQAFRNADKNGDGTLTREESPQPELFNEIDTDGNGGVTWEEFRVQIQRQRNAPQP
jgi:arylsulfatase A-like enzyme